MASPANTAGFRTKRIFDQAGIGQELPISLHNVVPDCSYVWHALLHSSEAIGRLDERVL